MAIFQNPCEGLSVSVHEGWFTLFQIYDIEDFKK